MQVERGGPQAEAACEEHGAVGPPLRQGRGRSGAGGIPSAATSPHAVRHPRGTAGALNSLLFCHKIWPGVEQRGRRCMEVWRREKNSRREADPRRGADSAAEGVGPDRITVYPALVNFETWYPQSPPTLASRPIFPNTRQRGRIPVTHFYRITLVTIRRARRRCFQSCALSKPNIHSHGCTPR